MGRKRRKSKTDIKQLNRANGSNTNGRFWIKLDGTDVKAAIMESQKKVWNGDVDYDDGKMKEAKG